MTTHDQARLVARFASLALMHLVHDIDETLEGCTWWNDGETLPTQGDLSDAISTMESRPPPAFEVVETGTVVMMVDGVPSSVEVRHGELVRVGPPMPTATPEDRVDEPAVYRHEPGGPLGDPTPWETERWLGHIDAGHSPEWADFLIIETRRRFGKLGLS